MNYRIKQDKFFIFVNHHKELGYKENYISYSKDMQLAPGIFYEISIATNEMFFCEIMGFIKCTALFDTEIIKDWQNKTKIEDYIQDLINLDLVEKYNEGDGNYGNKKDQY